jgi:cytochrome c oxidase subunit 2
MWSALALAQSASPAQLPQPWQFGFQASATSVKDWIGSLHDFLLVVITLITLFVLGLLVYVCVRFRKSANPTPSRVTHNAKLEVAWTLIPVLILVVIGIPSLQLLYYMDRTAEAQMTVKVTGFQWAWRYSYPDHGDLTFDSRMASWDGAREGRGQQGQHRLLDVDNRLVVPVGTNIRILVTSTDVMHSWFVPAFGVQTYAIIGRNNETWMNINRPGIYYGQCNQICGIDHGYMPIAIEAVPREQFDAWVAEARRRFAAAPAAPVVANAE